MAKKDFTAEFSELLGVEPQRTHSTTPATPQEPAAPTRKYGTEPTKNATAEEQRCTFVLDADILSRLRNAAYVETGKKGARVTIKDVLTEALQDYLRKKGY